MPMENWNQWGDPHASAIVFAAKDVDIRIVCFDVTIGLVMTRGEVERAFDTPLLKCVADFGIGWFEGSPIMTFHDPLAGACAFDHGLCTWQRGRVTVDVLNEQSWGMTDFIPDENGNCLAARTVDREGFFKEYFSVTKG